MRVIAGGEDFVGFAFDRAVPAGEIELHVDYAGAIDETSTQGVFRQKDGDAWYVYTQLETTDARRAFPCFDEPAYKSPWELTLTIPAGTSAVSNTPIASESPAKGGRKVVRFAKTEPLPAYLIAFGVGPFDYVDAGRAGMKKTPIRIVVPKGKASRARYAAETSGPILAKIEDYFGMPFPFAKLDQLVIPQTVTFSAMENAGLVTWSESVLLAQPKDESIQWKRLQASINAHEIAHQWFGDYVTLAWWDDVWLNESFATWLADRTIAEWQPSWGTAVERIVDRSNVMGDDTLVSARKIRQEIKSADDIANAFDSISYQKGGAVISMFEAWIGPAKFQAGVRRYMKAHAYGTGTSKEFLAAIEAESRPGVAAAFSTFLDQAGVPLLDVTLQCGGEGGPRLALAQKRFLPVGSEGSSTETWQIPVCARAAAGGGEASRACALLTETSGTMPAPGAASGGCPSWVLANDGEVGYYRAVYRGDSLEKLLAVADKELSVPERVGLLRDIDALAVGGATSMGQALALTPRFANDPNRYIVQATIRIATDAGENVLPDALRPAYARYVSKTFGPRARALGFTGKPGEDEDTRLLRSSLVPYVAKDGDEPELQAEAKRLALAWLADRSAVAAEMVGGVLESAARHGDRALFDKYKDGIKTSKERRDRNRLFRALGAFTRPRDSRRRVRVRDVARVRLARGRQHHLRVARHARGPRRDLEVPPGELRRHGRPDAAGGHRLRSVLRVRLLRREASGGSRRVLRGPRGETARRPAQPREGPREHGPLHRPPRQAGGESERGAGAVLTDAASAGRSYGPHGRGQRSGRDSPPTRCPVPTPSSPSTPTGPGRRNPFRPSPWWRRGRCT